MRVSQLPAARVALGDAHEVSPFLDVTIAVDTHFVIRCADDREIGRQGVDANRIAPGQLDGGVADGGSR
jgi:hypothetical protein